MRSDLFVYVAVASILCAAALSLIRTDRSYLMTRDSILLILIASSLAFTQFAMSRWSHEWLRYALSCLEIALAVAVSRTAVAEVTRNGLARLERYRARLKP
jgi:hypothetical protein